MRLNYGLLIIPDVTSLDYLFCQQMLLLPIHEHTLLSGSIFPLNGSSKQNHWDSMANKNRYAVTFIGKPCRACGCTVRYASTRACIDCQHRRSSAKEYLGFGDPVLLLAMRNWPLALSADD